MGKSKRNRCHKGAAAAAAAAAPLSRAADAKAEAQVEEEEFQDDPAADLVQRIKDQLQEASSETRECGLQSLALMVDRQSSGEVVGSKLVRVAAPLMAEMAHPNVRHAAVGALRNLSLVSPEVCDEMVKQVSWRKNASHLNTHCLTSLVFRT